MPHPTKTAVLVGEAIARASRIPMIALDEIKLLLVSKRADTAPVSPS